MQSVKVLKTKLIGILIENRAKHREMFEKAVEGYKTAAVSWLENMLEEVKKGEQPYLTFRQPVPFDATKEYDLRIKMLEMSLDTEITLDEQEFNQFVCDNWAWAQQSFAANSCYL